MISLSQLGQSMWFEYPEDDRRKLFEGLDKTREVLVKIKARLDVLEEKNTRRKLRKNQE